MNVVGRKWIEVQVIIVVKMDEIGLNGECSSKMGERSLSDECSSKKMDRILGDVYSSKNGWNEIKW